MRPGHLLILLASIGGCGSVFGASDAAAKPEAMSTVPQTRALYLQLIRQARMDGRARAAIAYLDDFDQRYPADFEARVLRINSLLDLGQTDQAEAIAKPLDAGKGSGDAQVAAINTVRGHLYAAREAWSDAAGCYQRAVDRNPTDPILRNDLGYALLRTGATDRAIEVLRGAGDLAPDDAVIRNNLILALAIGGHTDAMTRALAQIGDSRARSDLRKLVLAEAQRVTLPAAVPAPRTSPSANEGR